MKTDEEIRAWIDREIERSWYSAAGRRHHIGRKVGRILLTPNDTEWQLKHYQGCWPPGETQWTQVDRVLHEKLKPIWYGNHWKQRWYLLRDLVPVTREWRRVMRTRRFCSICQAQVDSSVRRYQGSHENPTHTKEFDQIIISRHFTIPRWEIDDDRRRPVESVREIRGFCLYLEWYRRERDSRLLCCSARCEATRFSRWLGLQHLKTTQYIKSQNRYRKEQQWIREGKQALKKVRQYLSQEA